MLISVQGAAAVRRSGHAEFVNAVRKMTLNTGDIVRTGATGHAGILFADSSQVKLNANTMVLIPAVGPGGGVPARMGVLRGEVWVRIARGRRTTIDAPTAVASIRGTELDLAVAEDGTSTLTVAEGEVQFSNEQGSVRVREGQQSIARPGQAPTAPQTVNVPFIIEWAQEVQPVVLLLEPVFVSQDPVRLRAAQREAEALPPGRERSRRLGDVSHDRGELPAAQAEYEKALGAGPGAAAAREPALPPAERAMLEAHLGQTLLELGQLPEAEAALRRSLELDPAGTAARASLVMTLLSRRQSADALSAARAAVAGDERSPVAHTALALAQIRSGEHAAAGQALDRALALDAGYAPAHAWRSFLLRLQGRVEEAGAAARRAVTLAPFSSLARHSLADTLFAMGETHEARREAARAVALNPLSPGARVSLGRALLQDGQIDRAAQEANRAVALDPDLERARFFYGVVLAEQRRLDRAASELRRAIELDPGYLEARAFLARVYLEQGRRGEAIAVVQEAMARDPDFAPALAALGRVHWRAGQLPAAAAAYRRALELQPGSVLYHLELARVYLDQNNLPDALANGLAAAGGAPASSEAHALLGLIYDRMENPEQALRAYRDALSFSPENALARIGAGLRNPNVDDGIVDISQALLRDPTVPSLRFKPGVTTEISPAVGSDDTYRLDGFHRDQYARGTVHDLSAFNQEWSGNYRDGRQERHTFGMLHLAAAPSYRTHALLQYIYNGRQRALPGPAFQPDPDDRSANSSNWWFLSVRKQVDPATSVWFRALRQVFRFREENPDAPRDAGLWLMTRTHHTATGLEGRLDHRWGRGHTLSYVLFGGRERLDVAARVYDPLRTAVRPRARNSRDTTVTHTFQDEYRPGSRLSLILGAAAQRSTSRTSQVATDQTRWLPFGQATYLLSERDLVRVIAHRRRKLIIDAALQPTEAFVIGEAPPILFSTATNYELDYEHRFSPRSFGKLFLFRSDVRDLFVIPPVDQAPTNDEQMVDIPVPRARNAGIGVRYERQIGRFLSSYVRYTYSELTDRTARSTHGWLLPMSPRSRAVFGLNFIDRAGTKVFAEASWQSRIFIDPVWSDREGFQDSTNREGFDPNAPRPTFPSKILLNLRLSKEPSVRREWVLSITDVFNTATLYWPGFPAPGRTYLLQYHTRF